MAKQDFIFFNPKAKHLFPSLVKKGFNINREHEEDGMTPLISACSESDLEHIKALVEAGADVNYQSMSYEAKDPDICYTKISPKYYEFYLHPKRADGMLTEQDTHHYGPGWSALMEACRQGNLEVVKYLVKKGANINAKNKFGWTPLMIACELGHSEIVDFLLKNGARINEKNKVKETALLIACKNGHKDIIMKLIKNNAKVNDRDLLRQTSLMYACQWGFVDAYKALRKKGAKIHVKSLFKSTMMMCACSNNTNIEDRLAILKDLRKAGCDVNERDIDLRTALINASCCKSNNKILNFLIDEGAIVDAEDKYGQTGLMYATAIAADAEMVGTLLDKGADPNHENINIKKDTPYLIAFLSGNPELIDRYIEKDFEENYRISGRTLLQRFLMLIPIDPDEEKLIIEMMQSENLIESDINEMYRKVAHKFSRNADISCILSEKHSFYGFENNFDKVIQSIIDGHKRKGGDVSAYLNNRDDDGWTALMIACRIKNTKAVKTLLENGADPNIPSDSGMTPLMLACNKGDLETVKILIKNGADPNISDEEGRTALMYLMECLDMAPTQEEKDKGENWPHDATKEDCLEIARILIDAGADIHAKDNKGSEVTDMTNNIEMLSLLFEKEKQTPSSSMSQEIK